MKIKNEYIKIINSLSLPILMNYLVTSIFEILDKAIIGHYSTNGFAVIGIASSVIFAITGSLGIFSVAYNIVAADMAGRQDEEMFEKTYNKSGYTVVINCSFIYQYYLYYVP
ncbi:MATE family efflux transporter [Clostridium sp. Marseille-P299]|uniref:MATE family efflux transporter n=1 Tax=Clostridium sp. Marseille-P299 TaxID=1805477 RepID=UPI00082E0E6F|nr:MATE family efflux transporter [Clostridium sp. Marseille-P299]